MRRECEPSRDDHVDRCVDINGQLVKHPADTFLLKVSGDSMMDAGIFNGNILVVDSKQEPRNGKRVVASIHDQPTVKTFRRDKTGKMTLMPENKSYDPIKVATNEDFKVLGCALGMVRNV